MVKKSSARQRHLWRGVKRSFATANSSKPGPALFISMTWGGLRHGTAMSSRRSHKVPKGYTLHDTSSGLHSQTGCSQFDSSTRSSPEHVGARPYLKWRRAAWTPQSLYGRHHLLAWFSLLPCCVCGLIDVVRCFFGSHVNLLAIVSVLRHWCVWLHVVVDFGQVDRLRLRMIERASSLQRVDP